MRVSDQVWRWRYLFIPVVVAIMCLAAVVSVLFGASRPNRVKPVRTPVPTLTAVSSTHVDLKCSSGVISLQLTNAAASDSSLLDSSGVCGARVPVTVQSSGGGVSFNRDTYVVLEYETPDTQVQVLAYGSNIPLLDRGSRAKLMDLVILASSSSQLTLSYIRGVGGKGVTTATFALVYANDIPHVATQEEALGLLSAKG